MRMNAVVVAAVALWVGPVAVRTQAPQSDREWAEAQRSAPRLAKAYRVQQFAYAVAVVEAQPKGVVQVGPIVCRKLTELKAIVVPILVRFCARPIPPATSIADCFRDMLKCEQATIGGVGADCDRRFTACTGGKPAPQG